MKKEVSHRDQRYSIGNTVNNTEITLYGDKGQLPLSWTFHNVLNIESLCCILKSNKILYVNCISIKKILMVILWSELKIYCMHKTGQKRCENIVHLKTSLNWNKVAAYKIWSLMLSPVARISLNPWIFLSLWPSRIYSGRWDVCMMFGEGMWSWHSYWW